MTGPGRSAGVASVITLMLMLLSSAGVARLVAQEVRTIKPGMTQAEVRTAWGAPFTVRTRGAHTFLYFTNDCLKRCGTYDIVFLEGGQVIDAIVRDKGRRYDGIASSPIDRKPTPTIVP